MTPPCSACQLLTGKQLNYVYAALHDQHAIAMLRYRVFVYLLEIHLQFRFIGAAKIMELSK